MQCNIDARGKAVRLIMGTVALIIGGVLLALGMLDVIRGPWAWGATIGAIAFGAFGIFEARAGWCIVRAMGIRTRI